MMLTVCPETLALRCPDQHFLLACGWLASGNLLTNPQQESPDMPEKYSSQYTGNHSNSCTSNMSQRHNIIFIELNIIHNVLNPR